MPPPDTTRLILPPDADELLAAAKDALPAPDFRNHRHCSDAVIAENALNQSVHTPHSAIRERLGLPDPTARKPVAKK